MRRQLTRCLPLALLALFLGPGRASAKGIILITHGDTINKVGDIRNPELRQQLAATGKNLAVGFKYSYFGIFWLDLWTWGGEYCVFEDKNYGPITAAQAAELMGVKESELGKPFLYRFPL